jgi:hypothetical protein
MTSTETISVSDLEEMLESEVPCGGVKGLGMTPCPEGNAAEFASYRCCAVADSPCGLKCHDCYGKWLHWAGSTGTGHARCTGCQLRMPIPEWYRPI